MLFRKADKVIKGRNLKMQLRRFRGKSVITALALGVFLSTTSYSISAQAATVKNGVSCKKAGLKTKAGSKNYVCGKNPYVAPTKLTWMLRQCPQTYDLYVESKDQYEIFKDILNMGGDEGRAEADKLLAGINSLESLMKTQVCKKGK
jgi:hypothetical protein